MKFVYNHFVQFYETDAMGVVHHSNYLRLMEEARTALFAAHDVLEMSGGLRMINYPVIEAKVDYAKPIYFADDVEITVLASFEKARIFFDYELKTKRFSTPVAFGKTVHIVMEMTGRKPIRIPEKIQNLLSK